MYGLPTTARVRLSTRVREPRARDACAATAPPHADPTPAALQVGDAFGRALTDGLADAATSVVLERDDGWFGVEPLAWCFETPEAWSETERRALEFVHGRVIDVATGAGRIALELQERGHDVLATDVSPLAIDACGRRGVARSALAGIDDVMSLGERVDTVTMLGGDLAFLGAEPTAQRILHAIYDGTGPDGRIVGSCANAPLTELVHIAYEQRNRRFGRLPGYRMLRVRYEDLVTPWFDYVLRSPAELTAAAENAGWKVTTLLGERSPQYAVVLEKA
jgi:SAM-dependent methyltransferase